MKLEKDISGPFFCSWSGGKDSCLALYRVLQQGDRAAALLTMLTEDGIRSRSHGLSLDLLQAQARSLDIPLITRPASWDRYEEAFVAALKGFSAQGIDHGVFGDIDLEHHLQWVENVCGRAGIQPHEPLWQQARRDLLQEFIGLGFTATVVAIRQESLDSSFLGRTLDLATVADMEAAGIDASGEKGEYHTVVTSGPIFAAPIELEFRGEHAHDGYLFVDVAPLESG